MLAHFSARGGIVKVHSVTTSPTSAYDPELFCPLPIGEFADTSREYLVSLDLHVGK